MLPPVHLFFMPVWEAEPYLLINTIYMADTIITNTPADRSDSGAAGWAVAVIILLVVVVGGFVWYRYYRVPAAAPAGQTNINVTIPNPATPAPAASGATQ